ncbi:MAG: type II toxin-antitoxin system RelE/ParE family toxin [Burkholderiales bacterium]|nr:type II toxin-antitoxin system RelE/ParE family toxin [Burkholderiales bacterium]
MFIVQQTDLFIEWFGALKDRTARLRIAARIRIVEQGSLGDWKSVGDGVSELRVDYGPGYRLYFTRRGEQVVVLLAGGGKRTQAADIKAAKAMAALL